jgi:hypothetical protein
MVASLHRIQSDLYFFLNIVFVCCCPSHISEQFVYNPYISLYLFCFITAWREYELRLILAALTSLPTSLVLPDRVSVFLFISILFSANRIHNLHRPESNACNSVLIPDVFFYFVIVSYKAHLEDSEDKTSNCFEPFRT